MNHVEKIMINARLQAAAEQAWREATQLHDAKIWIPDAAIGLHLSYMHEISASIDPSNQSLPQYEPAPIACGKPELLTLGVRIVFTAIQYQTDWFWIACRFRWDGRVEHNYTQ